MSRKRSAIAGLAKVFGDACAGKVVSSTIRTAQVEAGVRLVVAQRDDVDLIFGLSLRLLRAPDLEIGSYVCLHHAVSYEIYTSCISGTAFEVRRNRTHEYLEPIGFTARFLDVDRHLPEGLETSKLVRCDDLDNTRVYLIELARFATEGTVQHYLRYCSVSAIVDSIIGGALKSPIALVDKMKGAVLAYAGTQTQFSSWSTNFLEESRSRPKNVQSASEAFVDCLQQKRNVGRAEA